MDGIFTRSKTMENILSKSVLATLKQNAKNEVIANEAGKTAMAESAKILIGLCAKSKLKSAKTLEEWKDLVKSTCDALPDIKASIKNGNKEAILEGKDYKDWRITLYRHGNTYYDRDMIELKSNKEGFSIEQDKWETFDMDYLYKQDYKALGLGVNKEGKTNNPMQLAGPSWKKLCQPHKDKFANTVDKAYGRQMTAIARIFADEFGLKVENLTELDKAIKKHIAYDKSMRNLELDVKDARAIAQWLDNFPLSTK